MVSGRFAGADYHYHEPTQRDYHEPTQRAFEHGAEHEALQAVYAVIVYMAERKCPACGCTDIEVVEDDADFCLDCGEEVPDAVDELASKFANIVVGLVTEVDAIPKKKKLSKLTVDVGEDEPLTIVTNAKHMTEGIRVIVAKVGARPPNADEDDDDAVVKKANVGGVVSHGMLCDCPMLNWKGGAAAAAARVPDSFAPGDAPPDERPRMPTKS